MRFLQIASGDFFSTYGGGQVYVKNIVDEMIRQGLDVAVLSFVCKDTAIVEQDYKGISLWEVGTQAKDVDIEELVQTVSPDIIHAHSRKALFVTIGERKHIPVIVTAHHGGILCPAGALMNADECICRTTLSHEHCLRCSLANIRTGRNWYPLMKLLPKKAYIGLGKTLEKLPFIPFISPIGGVALSIENKIKEWQTICDKASKVIAPSHAIADAMCRNGLSRDKVAVIPHGVARPLEGQLNVEPYRVRGVQCSVRRGEDLNSEKQINSLRVGNDKIRFFYVGRIGRLKGIHVLLDAFSKLKKCNDVELHIIGEASQNKVSKRYLKSLLAKYQSSDIIWHGKIPPYKIFDAIKEYDVMVHPTICLEVFGLNIAEALAMNKPVLATRCGGAEMQVVDGVNGWLVSPNDVQALCMKMNEIVEHGIVMDLDTLNKGVIAIDKHVNDLKNLYKIICDVQI